MLPVDGGWASWGSYGACTVTCGGGTQVRSRTCTNPAPQYLGANCVGSSTSSQSCSTQNCPGKLNVDVFYMFLLHVSFNMAFNNRNCSVESFI